MGRITADNCCEIFMPVILQRTLSGEETWRRGQRRGPWGRRGSGR